MILFTLSQSLITIPVIGLSGISLFQIASTSPQLFWSQAIFISLGLFIFFLFSSIDFRLWSKFVWLIYTIALVSLILSFFGPEVRGATRWIDVWSFRLQPSEIMKPFLIMVFAKLAASRHSYNLPFLLKSMLFFFPIIALVFKQPDLGNVLVFLTIFIAQEFVGGLPWWYIFLGFASFAILFPLIWPILAGYQRLRLISYLNPQSDPIGAGYNALQAMITIGSGKLLGLGLGRGTQSRLLFLPEYHTDFVFASVAEELGFVGAGAVILFYFLLLGKILHAAIFSQNLFGKLVAVGIFAQFFIQVFINIGMNMGLMPITGITLPLLSYGGSSIISTFISLGLVISILRTQKTSPLVIR